MSEVNDTEDTTNTPVNPNQTDEPASAYTPPAELNDDTPAPASAPLPEPALPEPAPTGVVDLDALIPEAVVIKIFGSELTINPPKTSDILMLGKLAQRLENLEKLDESQMEKVIKDISRQFTKIIPGLENRELNMAQLLKLIQIVSEMATPPDAKELADRGIKPVDNQKKAQ